MIVPHFRVLVVEEDSLFRNGIESSLRHANMQIIGTAPADIHVIVAEIKRTNPTAIILNDQSDNIDAQLILNLLNIYPTLKIIGLSLEHNRLNVYGKQEVQVTTTDDLISAIIDSAGSPPTKPTTS